MKSAINYCNKCKCESLSQELTGEGCDVCNPARGLEYAMQTITDQAQEIRELEAQLADARREAAEAQAREAHTHQALSIVLDECVTEDGVPVGVKLDEPLRHCVMLVANRQLPEGFYLQSAIEQAVAEERETCAVVAENSSPRHTECGIKIARAIRARSPA